MSSRRALMKTSCSRCQSKKVRCNRVGPRCDKCESAGTECAYLPRKPRARKQRNNINEAGALFDVLQRLQRLEEHCGLKEAPDLDQHGNRSMSFSSPDSDTFRPESSTEPQAAGMPGVIDAILSRIKNPESRALLCHNVFSHVRMVESCFFQNKPCVDAIAAAMSELEYLQDTPANEPSNSLEIPKDLTKHLIENYFGFYQFEGFKIPMEKSFLLSIPDLLENPHVQLDYTSQIIYHTICLQAIVLDSSHFKDNGSLIRYLYRKCLDLADGWLDHIQNTPADLFAAFAVLSMTIETCNSELAWKILGHACTISKALGYFSVDADLEEADRQPSLAQESTINETEIDKNRKRFKFWHLLRTDSLFRICFGKPTLIPAGSWKVNFPDLTINGIDDESSRFIQIHFLASMRLSIVVMKYLDWIDSGPDSDQILHDATVDNFIREVQLIMSDWDTDDLLRMAKTQVDTLFCVDMVFSTYKILIILHQSKKSDQQKHCLSRQSVDISRKSLQMFKPLVRSSLRTYWGISLILLDQFIPFFIICLDIIGNPEHDNIEEDMLSVFWIHDYVEQLVEERVELKPVMIVMKAMVSACQESRKNELASSMTVKA